MGADEFRGQTARVFADVRDFPIYVSHIDDHTRMWFAPWRIWDGVVFLTGTMLTCWATWRWLESGSATLIFIGGAAATAAATFAARQIPSTRPQPLYRAWWLLGCLLFTQRRSGPRP